MTIAIPPSLLVQSFLALAAGFVLGLVGTFALRRAWHYHDHRSERDFLLGFLALTVGVSWLVLGLAIAFGILFDGPAEQAITEMVVFTNAAARIVVLLLGLYLALEEWRWRHHAP